MRPGPIIVTILTIGLIVAGVSWLGQSVSDVTVTPGPEPPAHSHTSTGPSLIEISPEGPYPLCEFPEIEHNFGTMKRYSSGSHKFVVTNNGEATLQLKAGDTTCQCTVGELGATEIAPGESTTVELSWTIKQPGPGFHHSAEIHTNDPKNRKQTLIVKGFIGVDVATWPDSRWSMGSLGTDGTTRFEGYVFSHISDDFKIVKMEPSVPGLQFEIEALSEENLAELAVQMVSELADPPDPHGNNPEPKYPKLHAGYRVKVTADSNIPVGQFSVPVTVHTTLEDAPTIPIVVSGVRPGPYQFFPLPGTTYRHGAMLIDAGKISPTKEETAGLLVVCRGFDGELKIDGVTSDPAWLKVSLEPHPSAGTVRRYRLEVKFPSGLPPMERSLENPATLVLRTNHPDAATLNLKAAFVVEE